MDWLSNMQVKPLLILTVLILTLVILMSYFAKKGLISFSGKGLQIGETRARELIQRQMEYIDAKALEFSSEYGDSDKVKYIREKCKDILDKAVVLNSMSTDSSYTLVKCLAVWATIQRQNIPDEFKAPEFKTKVFDVVTKTIQDLVKIKNQFN